MIKWNEYTWYSKLLAVIFFICILPAWTFYIGVRYENTKEILREESFISATEKHSEQNASVTAYSTSTLVISAHTSTSQDLSSEVISSSTSGVGEFTVIVTCKNRNPFSIEILKGGSILQTLGIFAADIGISKCPIVQSQDINFDGNPDFMILSDTGSGGASLTYWLYSTSTQKFYCPESHNDCNLMNPTFDPASKTITSTDYTGAGSVDIQTYKIANDKLVLIKEVKTDR